MRESAGRLLWITDRYPPHKGGMAVSCERLVSGFRRREFDLDLFIFSAEPGPQRLEQTERDRGTDFRLAAEVSPGNAAQLAWNVVQRRNLVRPYTFVIGFGAGVAGVAAVTFAAWLELPSLVLVRGNDFDRDWFDPRRGLLVREALSRATVIGTAAPVTAERIHRLFPGAKVIWTPNSVDTSQWELLPGEQARREDVRAELAAGRRVFGIFGEIKYKKRIPLWLGALRDTGRKDEVGLLVVGRLDEETTQILDDPVLTPPNKRLPFTSPDQLPALYAACDFIVLPSLFDGMPNVLLEAMAAGVIPIASDAGAMSAVIEDGQTGFLFPAEDRAAAAVATLRALELTEAELAAMSARVREHVARNFSPERELDIIAGIIAAEARAKG